MPSYLNYEYYLFFHFELRSDPELDPDPIFFLQLSRIRIRGKKSDSYPLKETNKKSRKQLIRGWIRTVLGTEIVCVTDGDPYFGIPGSVGN